MKKIFLSILLYAFAVQCYAQDQNSNSSSKIDLARASLISVTVGGAFITNGTFPASMTERVDQFITRIFTEAGSRTLSAARDEKLIAKVKSELDGYAKRDITLKRISGEVIKLDLEKFRLTGDFKFNPYLRNDDVIIFPAFDLNTGFVEIIGAVNKETKFQFVDGDNLSDALLFAGGLNKAYDNIKSAEISRLNNSGDREEIISADIDGAFPLKRGDRIRVVADPNQKRVFKALVLGEVKNPGYVYIKQNGSLLNEVIQKAGGFTSLADLSRAEVVRNYNAIEMMKKYQLTDEYLNSPEKYYLPETMLKMRQMQDALTLLRTDNLQLEDTLFFSIDNQLRVLRGESLVDFTKLSDPQSDESNFSIKDGDLIIVPQPFDYVYVFGQVANFGYIKYSEGKNYKYYLEKAGGKTEMARDGDEEDVVIKGKGKSWITKNKENIKIEAGDYIYVPKVIPRNFNFYLSRIGSIAGIVGSVATIILLLVQFGK